MTENMSVTIETSLEGSPHTVIITKHFKKSFLVVDMTCALSTYGDVVYMCTDKNGAKTRFDDIPK